MKAKALLLLAPAILTVLFTLLHRQEKGNAVAGRPEGREIRQAGGREGHRLIVVIVDSLRKDTLEKPGVMPHLLALARDEAIRRFPLLTCTANFTLPCMQTLMEGRDSPFVSGLHNFTGMEGGAGSMARSMQDAGLRLALVGDHTLLDLYGRHAAVAWGIESVAGDPLRRDLAAIDKAVELLDAQPAFDALLLHVPGTDKAAHHKRPGTALYDEHHRLVDAALLQVWQRVDPRRDDLLVMGDHGHDDRGDHTRNSLVLMRGPSFAELLAGLESVPEGIAQEELIYFMSYPFALPLNPSYEGRFFLSRAAGREDASQPSDAQRRFEEVQRRVMIGKNGADCTLAEWAAHRETSRREKPREHFFRLLPLLTLFLFWALFLFEGRLRPGRGALTVTLLCCGMAVGLYLIATPASGPPLAALGLGASMLVAWRTKARRNFIFLLVVLTGAGLMGTFAPDWTELMHSRRSFNAQALLFHLLLPLAGAGLALLRFGRLSRFPEGMGLIGLLMLPSGVYYYQAGRNLLFGYALGEALLLFGKGVPLGKWWEKVLLRADVLPLRGLCRPRRMAAVVIFAFAVAVLLGQDAGGWEWGLWLVKWMRSCPVWVPVLFFWVVGGYLVWQAPTALGRMLLLGVLGFIQAYSAGLAGLDPAALGASLVAVLLLDAVLELDPTVSRDSTGGEAANSELSEADADGAAARDALLLAGVVVWMLWVLLRGFFISHVEYQFGFDLLGEFSRESYQALAFTLATLLKYGLPLFFALLVYYYRRGHAAAMSVLAGLLFLLQLKMIALLIQALLMPLRTTEKLHELAMADIGFILIIILVVALTYLGLWLCGKPEAATVVQCDAKRRLRPAL